MPIDFPSSPTTGQVYTYQGKSWIWNGSAWDVPKALSEIGAVRTFDNATARNLAIPTPSEGIVTYLNDTNALEVYNNGWNMLNPSSGNVIINGAFDIWQRGASITGGGYTADRWFVENSSTTTRDLSTPNSTGFSLKTIRTTGTGTFIQHRLESSDAQVLAGKTVTISWWAKEEVANNDKIVASFSYPNTTDNFSSVTLILNSPQFTLSTSWQKFTFTLTLPNEVQNGLRITFAFQDINKSFYLAETQLETGSVATPFKRNAPSIQAELAACQRYYQRWQSEGVFSYLGGFINGSTTTQAFGFVNAFVPFRVKPSSVFFGNDLSLSSLSEGRTAITNITLNSNITAVLPMVTITTAGGLANGALYKFQANNNANAFIAFSAEL
jgi:hypothetical protein